MDTVPARQPPPAAAAASVSRWVITTPPTAEGEAAAASQPAASNTTHVSSTPSLPGGDSAAGAAVAAREVVVPAGGAAPATGAASYPSADSLSPLLLQVSALSDGSLPLGQGRQRAEGPGASTAASQPLSPMQSPISTISNSSYQSTQSRDPRLNRSASAHSRGADTEAEDDSALPANTNARPGRKRVLSGGKSGPTKATRKQSKGRSVSPPSQHISQSASP